MKITRNKQRQLYHVFISYTDLGIILTIAFAIVMLVCNISCFNVVNERSNTKTELKNSINPLNSKVMKTKNIVNKRRRNTAYINGKLLIERDLKIIDMIVKGCPDKLIAHKLGIQQSTLDFHKHKLYIKMEASCKSDVVVKAFRNNLSC